MTHGSADVRTTSLATIIAFRGDCDVHSKKLVAQRLSAGAEAENLIVDLSEVTYLDSVILGALMDVVRRRRDHHQEAPIVVAANAFIRKIFAIAGMDVKLDIQDTARDAMRITFERSLARL